MKVTEFAQSPSGRLIGIDRGQSAFAPNPLPPAVIDHAALAPKLAVANLALGELNGIGRTIDDPMLLIRPLQYQEALTSSGMEGTYTTIDELLLAETGETSGAQATSSDTREVNNFRQALTEAIASLDDPASPPLSLRTLKQAHARLMDGVARHRGAAIRAGEFKSHQNYIGPSVEKARFIPPPPVEALEAMHDLERYIQRQDAGAIPDLIDAALVHYQFETIHPFADGNGRVGRMLITLHLYMRKALTKPLLYLSPVFERRKNEYIDLMFAVSRDGAWTPWIAFFLEVVTESAHHAVRISDELLALKREIQSRLQTSGRSARLLGIVDALFRRPMISIPQVSTILGVSYPTAQKSVAQLVEAGILTESQHHSSPRLFVARPIIDIINKTQTAHARSSV